MKILHTADWHLGCSLGAEKRFDEHAALIDYLCKVIAEEKIEAVIIAGDVFDTSIPPNRAAEQYYDFLLKAGQSGVRTIIVTGGNHDSASYLEATREILKFLKVYVFASADQECSAMTVELKEKDGRTAALVGCVPYLHERDLVTVSGGQGVTERESTLRSALLAYYQKMADTLEAMAPGVPHIVTGHLFATDRGEKNDSWTGSLMSVETAEFPDSIDYLALGHLHDAHTLKTPHNTCIRYPGAPLNISFRELEVSKSVTVIDTEDIKNIREVTLPLFQDMRQIKGSREEIERELISLTGAGHSVWCSLENTGDYEPGLADNMNALVSGSEVKILSCRNRSSNPAVLERLPEERHLADLPPVEVFKLMLKEYEIPESETDELLGAFNEIETAVREEEC